MADEMPPSLSSRPFDPRRKLPIPVANTWDDGSWDFTAINGQRSVRCGQERRCGLCGVIIGWWVAFLGGARSVESRVFTDPPMHVDCAEAATRLCPHIARPAMQRAPEVNGPRSPHGGDPDVVKPPGMTLERPERWGLYVTRQYEMKPVPVNETSWVMRFHPAPPKEVRWYDYDADGVLRVAL